MNPALDPHRLPEQLNISDVFLYRQLAARGSSTALHTCDGNVSYAQLGDQASRAAAVFRGLGLELEQRVLLMLPDVPEFASAWFGVSRAGGVVGAVHPEQKPEEIAYYLNYTRARLLVVHQSTLDAVEQVRSGCPFLKQVLVVGGPSGRHLSYERELEAARPEAKGAATHRDDPAVWLFTSGSTGFPKAAVHKQRDLLDSPYRSWRSATL